MFRRRRYGTPFNPWARTKRAGVPTLPKSGEEWRELSRSPRAWRRGAIAGFVLFLVAGIGGSLLAPPPLPDLTAYATTVNVEGTRMPRLTNWAFYRPTAGLERPWILFAPGGEVGKPATTITIYAPVVTETVAKLLREAGPTGLRRAEILEKILRSWASSSTDELTVPEPVFTEITSGSEGTRLELATLVTFPTPFPYAPLTASPTPSPTASASPSTTDNGLGPLLDLPARGTETDQRVVVKIAAFLPSVAAYDAPNKQRMLVVALSYDASLSADRIAAIEAGFTAFYTRIEFP